MAAVSHSSLSPSTQEEACSFSFSRLVLFMGSETNRLVPRRSAADSPRDVAALGLPSFCSVRFHPAPIARRRIGALAGAQSRRRRCARTSSRMLIDKPLALVPCARTWAGLGMPEFPIPIPLGLRVAWNLQRRPMFHHTYEVACVGFASPTTVGFAARSSG